MDTVRSALIWAAIVGLIVIWLPLLAVVRLFDRDPARYRTGRFFRQLGVAMTRVNPYWNIELEGHFPEDPRRPFVVVANHQSIGDIAVVSCLPWEMKWVAKAELFRLPVAGWMMRLAGDIPVDRGDAQSRRRVFWRARRVLERRCSVMFFPEGTRSKDARVRRFQAGAFRLAIEAGVPILPVAVDGTSDAIPKHGWRFAQRLRARVGVLELVATTGRSPDDAVALAEEVRQRIVGQIAAWRGTSPESVDAYAGGPPRDGIKEDELRPGTGGAVEESAKSP
jgi:1-acyl-sn-glycerol-3-phosphate acyltransferase